MVFKNIALGLFLVGLSSFSPKKKDDIKNYYGIPTILNFNNTNYKLLASYHPNEVYYKQEYVPTNETGEHYNTMLIIDFVITDKPTLSIVQHKEMEVTARKKNDPVANYEQLENDDLREYMLDFMMSEGDGEKLTLVERNIYRYKTYTDKSGKTGVLLFGLSQRGYGDGLKSFFTSIKENRINDINKVGAYQIPSININ